jgi:hypothetical protein
MASRMLPQVRDVPVNVQFGPKLSLSRLVRAHPVEPLSAVSGLRVGELELTG